VVEHLADRDPDEVPLRTVVQPIVRQSQLLRYLLNCLANMGSFWSKNVCVDILRRLPSIEKQDQGSASRNSDLRPFASSSQLRSEGIKRVSNVLSRELHAITLSANLTCVECVAAVPCSVIWRIPYFIEKL